MLVDTPWAGPIAKVISGPDIMVDDGVFIDNVKNNYEILLSVDEQADNPEEFQPCDIHGSTRNLMFSSRLIDILNKQGVDNIQYFNANTIYEPTGEQYNYKIANVLGIISGLDMDKSDVILSRKGNVLEIEKMVLDEEKMQGHNIFRLQESIMHIVVHKTIKEAIEAEKLTGFMFVPDEEFEPGML